MSKREPFEKQGSASSRAGGRPDRRGRGGGEKARGARHGLGRGLWAWGRGLGAWPWGEADNVDLKRGSGFAECSDRERGWGPGEVGSGAVPEL